MTRFGYTWDVDSDNMCATKQKFVTLINNGNSQDPFPVFMSEHRAPWIILKSPKYSTESDWDILGYFRHLIKKFLNANGFWFLHNTFISRWECVLTKTEAQRKRRGILICVGWMALKKRSIAVKTWAVSLALSYSERTILCVTCNLFTRIELSCLTPVNPYRSVCPDP